MSRGCVYLVGAGPGDPRLLTIRGRELLARADVVVYDHLVAQQLLLIAPRQAERIYVGKQSGAHELDQDQINRSLVALGQAGKQVVRLKGGDPFVFGRGGEEALALVAGGVDFEVVPGVTAAVGAAAYAGIPLTHRGLASNLGLITGHESPVKAGADLNYQSLADWKGTLAFYMGVKNLGAISRELISHGLAGQTPAALIRWGTTARQQVLTGTVASIAEQARIAAFRPPALIVIGHVVTLRDKLNWFERRALFGRRVVVTRAGSQAQGLVGVLQELGAEVWEFPTIRIEPPDDRAAIDRVVRQLGQFDWIVFTSANAVNAFFDALGEAGLDSRALGANRLCAIGPATAGRLGEFGLRPDVQPGEFVTAAIPDALGAACELAGARVLCPRSDAAGDELTDSLAARGAIVTNVIAYRTLAVEADAAPLLKLLAEKDVDWITFTSSSTVRNFFAVVPAEAVRAGAVKLASIGPVTSAALEQLGFAPAVEAEPHTAEAMVKAIAAHEG